MRTGRQQDSITARIDGTNGAVSQATAAVICVRESAGQYRVYFPPNFTLRGATVCLDGVAAMVSGVDNLTRNSMRILVTNTSAVFADWHTRFQATGTWAA